MNGASLDLTVAVCRHGAWLAALALVPTALALGVALPPAGAGESAQATLLSWLILPATVAAAGAVVLALEHWPLFAREQDGARLVRRAAWTALDGCGRASLGALVGAVPLLAGIGLAFSVLARTIAPDLPCPRAWEVVAPVGHGAVLDREHRRLEFSRTGRGACDLLRLNPIAVARAGTWSPAVLSIAVDGRELAAPVTIDGTRPQVELALPAGTSATSIALTWTGESALALVFPPDGVELRQSGPRSLTANLMLAGIAFAVPIALALAVAMLTRRALAAPAQTVVTLAALALALVPETGPVRTALRACARGRWLLAEPWANALVLPAASATILCLLAMLPSFADRRRRAATGGNPR